MRASGTRRAVLGAAVSLEGDARARSRRVEIAGVPAAGARLWRSYLDLSRVKTIEHAEVDEFIAASGALSARRQVLRGLS